MGKQPYDDYDDDDDWQKDDRIDADHITERDGLFFIIMVLLLLFLCGTVVLLTGHVMLTFK